MPIAVISDTHLEGPIPWFEEIYTRHLAAADAILHCGDFTGFPLYAYLLQHPNFHAVAGNMDCWTLSQELPPTREVEVLGLRIGLVHGWGHGADLADRVAQAFRPGLDLICFGHAHIFEWDTRHGMRVLNPGSLCAPRRGEASLALVSVGPDGEISVERVEVGRPGRS